MVVAASLVACLVGAGCGSEADAVLDEESEQLEESSASLLMGLTVTPSSPVAGISRNEISAKLSLGTRGAGLAFLQPNSAATVQATRVSLHLTANPERRC
jgi:hypothetical protein